MKPGANFRVQVLVAALAVAAAPTARAESARDIGADLSEAADALRSGEFSRAAELAGELARRAGPAPDPDAPDDAAPGGVSRADRAEAWRIFGLALFFEGSLARAEAALLEYLKLEEDAHLDPSLVPPEAIAFFEDVRLRHADEIRAYHPDPEPRRWLLLNLAPPAGQFQNGDRGKGWAIAGAGTALIGANVGTYLLLRRWCDSGNHLCGAGGSRYGEARALQIANVASLAGLGALYVYGAIDGFAGFRRGSGALSISLAPGGLPGLALTGRF